MNMIRTDPMENEARFVRMVLVECFVGASTWSDMQKIGEALSKLNRIEKDMRAEWQHLNPMPAAAGQRRSGCGDGCSGCSECKPDGGAPPERTDGAPRG